MLPRGSRAWRHWAVLPALLLAANAAILLTGAGWLRLLAGCALLFALPGIAWLRALGWLGSRRGLERLVWTAGLSTALASIAMLVAVYWPQPLNLTQTLLVLDAFTLAGVLVELIWPSLGRSVNPNRHARLEWPSGWVLVALLVIFAVALFLRWYALGYGEFHEDELENMRLAVRAMKGEEYAPFLDSKGPIHWLLPAALWMMHGWINEAIARIVFALCSSLTVLAVYSLGRRMLSEKVALVAAGAMAINGLLVAYARHVENPSLIVFWAVLAAWCGYRVYRLRHRPGAEATVVQVTGWLLLGVGLMAHPNMILYVPPFAFLIAASYWHNPPFWKRQWPVLVVGVLLLLGLAAGFYVPFRLDPNFQLSVTYFAEERVGTGLFYNGIAGLLSLEADYSTRYYMPLIVLFTGVLFWHEFKKSGRKGQVVFALLGLMILSTALWPQLWQWGPVNAAFVPLTLLLAALVIMPAVAFEVKALVLWFGIPYLALTFFAKDAATHIRNAYPAWFLLAAAGFWLYWRAIPQSVARWVKAGSLVVVAVAAGLIVYYEYVEFLGPVTNYWQIEADAKYNPNSIYRVLYGQMPRPRKLVSNPRLGGWKVVGSLYDEGVLSGDFRSIQESFAVPIWYTHQMPRSCYEDPENYFVRLDSRGEPPEIQDLLANGYGKTAVVLVDHQPKLYLFKKGAPAPENPAVYDLNDYRAQFDRSATPERYVQGQVPQHRQQIRFGDSLVLLGYDLSPHALQPGQTLTLTLYWQAIAPMAVRYRAFVHVEDQQMWGQHDDDPVCRLRTDEWRPPQTGQGQFRVTLDAGTPAGTYPLTIGVYDPNNGERLEVFDQSGQSLGSMLQLDTVSVTR